MNNPELIHTRFFEHTEESAMLSVDNVETIVQL